MTDNPFKWHRRRHAAGSFHGIFPLASRRALLIRINYSNGQSDSISTAEMSPGQPASENMNRLVSHFFARPLRDGQPTISTEASEEDRGRCVCHATN